jgi:hypothetical protein
MGPERKEALHDRALAGGRSAPPCGHRTLPARAAVLALLLAAAGPAFGQGCRLALSLGLDVSSSVDSREYRLQTDGTAAALIAPEVTEAFLSQPEAPVILQIFEWSGWQQQLVRVDWVTLTSEADLVQVAAQLRAQARSFEQYPTAVGSALLFGGRAVTRRQDCAQRTLDLASDGTNNDGIAPELARQEFPGLTVNALVLGANSETLARYYEEFVIQGPDAFVLRADDYADFEKAMRWKLLRELGVIEVSGDGGRDRTTSERDLVEQGKTVVVIERNLNVIKTADHIIDIAAE